MSDGKESERRSGVSIRDAARETGIPEKRLRRAAENGEVKTVEFGGVEKLPISEVERLKKLYA
ncbi:hypothetical protein [Mesorhizobium kowhaii]|uniref:DNA-binding protein n=1 Tax=Mesorhizobium kowhaii TaxID=1300272 RepID=A0A2W7CPR3_9HYPH|nr:hypothetical protein [Mesorhizobium kowhaii]PZV38543.1 hypothetical protein B5V02_10845 [Mesorhizobium kowhaii]